MKKYFTAAALFALMATSASAYTGYLKPDQFWPEDSVVAIEGSFASEFFTPAIALPADDMSLINPQGASQQFDSVVIENEATRIEAGVPVGGTYRISTGEQMGQVVTLVAENGAWRVLGEGETPAAATQTTTLQPVTQADVYVTRGQPTRGSVDSPSGTLALRPVTHPNQVLHTQGMEVEVLFNGAPLPNLAVVLYAAGEPDTDLESYVVTNEMGRATFTFPAPGAYVIAARHRAQAPAGAEAAIRSYTTTLTLEAYAQLPETYDVAAREAQQNAQRERAASAATNPARRPARRRVGRPDN